MEDIVFITPPLTLASAIEETISDYIHCHRLEANVDTVCKAITLAVDYGEYIYKNIVNYCRTGNFVSVTLSQYSQWKPNRENIIRGEKMTS